MVGFDSLPMDVLIENVIGLLDKDSIVNLSLVSKCLYRITRDDYIWKRLCYDKFNISPDIAFRRNNWLELYNSLSHSIVYAWGENENQRLGIPSEDGRAWGRSPVVVPTEVVSLRNKNIIDLVSGGWSFHALDANGIVYTWGSIRGHQLFIPGELGVKPVRTPTPLQSRASDEDRIRFRAISSGRAHAIGIGKDYSVWHWSNPEILQKVDLSMVDSPVVQVSANWHYSSMLSAFGTLYRIDYPAAVKDYQTPADIEPTIPTYEISLRDINSGSQPPDKIIQIAGMIGYTLALTQYGKVIKLDTSVPDNYIHRPKAYLQELKHFSQRNKNEMNNRNGRMKRFITGAFQNFAVYTLEGEVLLGRVEATADTIPVRNHDLDTKDICKVSFGDYHVGALSNQGQLYTWGNYSSGALGHEDLEAGSTLDTPRLVTALSGMFVFAIGFGGWQSSALAYPIRDDL